MSLYSDIKKEDSSNVTIKLNHYGLHYPRFEVETIRVQL